MNEQPVDELLQAIRHALTSPEGLDTIHHLGARHEAAIHAGIEQRLAALDPAAE
jgi:hypothetical protein